MSTAWPLALACTLSVLAPPGPLVAHDKPPAPKPTPHRPPPATCEVLEVRSDQAPRRRHSFRATRIVDLELAARLDGRPQHERRLELRVYTPRGFLYQVLEPEVDPSKPAKRVFRARLPVAGTSIMTSGLYGRWKVVAYVVGVREPCGRAQSFVLRP